MRQVMRVMRHGLAAAALLTLLAPVTSALAFGLSEGDYAYLATRGVEHTSSVLGDLSPREQARLHAVINDAATTGNDAAREAAVVNALDEFRGRQAWEATHPDELLTVKRR
jgi:hypothetical protein